MVYSQSIGSEEVYFGSLDKDPTSTCSDNLLLRSFWPGHSAAEITVEFEEQFAVLFSSKLFLRVHLPYAFDKKAGKAKFVSDKGILEITLPVTRE